MNRIGPDELKKMPAPFDFGKLSAPAIPFSEEVLTHYAGTHLLIYTPSTFADGAPVTINELRKRFGTDPAVSEPCLYNQDWYLKEDFAATTTPNNAWHLMRIPVLEDARAKDPEEIEASLTSHEAFPMAVTCAFAFFAFWFHTGGQRLWNHDFVWCSDHDHNDDRIYIGRYEDPAGVNKNGLNIHRHLALSPSYSAAPEVGN